jgi:cysteine desulfurase family protein
MIYLDNAATSYPKPECVGETVTHALRDWGGNPGRSGHRLSLAASEAIYRSRVAVASLLHAANEENVIFTQNATYAINTILRARVKPGSHILISDMEHNSVRRPVYRLCEDGLITYDIFSHTGNICENISHAITPHTDMLICTHISNVNGFIFPVEEIARLCRQKGIYMVLDASQSIGHRSVTVDRIDCDAVCAPGHKGLYGIQGSGFLYVRNAEGLRDVFQGGSGAHSLSPRMPEYLPDRFEAGTLPTPAIASLHAGIGWIEKRGIDTIEAQEKSFSARLHAYLSELPEITLYSAPDTGIVAFNISGIPSERVADLLDHHGICVRGGLHCSPLAHRSLGTSDSGIVRISAGAFTSLEEADLVRHHLDAIIRELSEK